MYRHRVYVYPDWSRTRVLRVVHAAEAERLVRDGLATPVLDSRARPVRSVVLSPTGASRNRVSPFSRVIRQRLVEAGVIVAHCYAMRYAGPDGSWVI